MSREREGQRKERRIDQGETSPTSTDSVDPIRRLPSFLRHFPTHLNPATSALSIRSPTRLTSTVAAKRIPGRPLRLRRPTKCRDEARDSVSLVEGHRTGMESRVGIWHQRWLVRRLQEGGNRRRRRWDPLRSVRQESLRCRMGSDQDHRSDSTRSPLRLRRNKEVERIRRRSGLESRYRQRCAARSLRPPIRSIRRLSSHLVRAQEWDTHRTESRRRTVFRLDYRRIALRPPRRSRFPPLRSRFHRPRRDFLDRRVGLDREEDWERTICSR